MAERYTYADVIIDPKDKRVEIGKEYFCNFGPLNVLNEANTNAPTGILKDVIEGMSEPFKFESGYRWSHIIRKKEPEKKYVPFDLSKEEVRKKLRGAWIGIKDYPLIEYQITSLNKAYVFCSAQKEGISPEQLLMFYQFVDGSPCGELVKEEL